MLLSFVSLLKTYVKACSECGGALLGGAGALGPIITIPAYTLPKARAVFGTSLNFVDFSGLGASKFRYLNNNFLHAHSHGNTLNLSLNAAIGITDNFTLSASLPYNFLFNIKSAEEDGTTVNEGSSIGFGDLTLLGKYRFVNSKKHKLQSSVLAGIKMATGQTNERDEFNNRLSSDHQPGTGSWDPIMGFSISKSTDKDLGFDLNALYRISTTSFDDLIIGDSLNYNFAVSHGLSKLDKGKFNIDAALELNSRWQEKTEYQGIKEEGHGGTRVFLTPGIRLVYDEKWISSFALGFPIIEAMSGEQADANLQLFFNLARIF